MASEYLLGIDIGGTFTDFVLCDGISGRVWLAKHLTSADDPARAVREGLAELLQRADISGEDIHVIIHGTTLITNALIERRGEPTALLVTAGHRDVLEIGTEIRYDSYDLHLELPQPLVPRYLRYDVPERLLPDGEVLEPLNEAAVAEIGRALVAQNVRGVAICFLHSFVNPAHEQRAREILAELMPGTAISLSSEVAPEIREYSRMSTTAANAYVQPIAERYLYNLHNDLKAAGYAKPLYMMLSSGGITTHHTAARFPIRLVESGPAAGALAAVTLGQRTGHADLIAFDMGGTTAKASLIDGGTLTTSKEFEVARVKRFKKGSGLPLQTPVIEMIEIGAGGGSIAHIDDLGLLKVGPESASSSPGPACYGRGGKLPTVTDADLLLGYLDPNFFLGGSMVLDVEAAREAMQGLANTLGLDMIRLAWGIFDVVNSNMIAATKVHISERGRDPRRYALVAFGGMGPMHAHAVARGLKLREVMCPASAGVLSAWGMLVAPTSFEFARSLVGTLDAARLLGVAHVFHQMEEEGERTLLEAGVSQENIRYLHSADMRFAGQKRELTVPLPRDVSEGSVASLRQVFLDHYRDVYGHVHEDLPVEIVTCRLTATSPQRAVPNRGVTGGAATALKGERQVFFGMAEGFVRTAVYDRYGLRPGVRFAGPAVVEERESTAVVPPGATAWVDDEFNLIIQFPEAQV